MDGVRFKKAAELAGFAIPQGASLTDMRSIVAQRKTVNAKSGKGEPVKTPIPDENVFRANDEDLKQFGPEEIDRRWTWVKQMTLKPTDLSIVIDELEDNHEHLLINGWYVVLKELDRWYYRSVSYDETEPQGEASGRSMLREEQDTAYAITQCADYERGGEEENDNGAEEKKKLADPSIETTIKPSGTVALATAIDDSNHAYKRRLVDALAVNPNVSVSATHQFSRWIFESQEKCTVDEKRRFKSFWEGESKTGAARLQNETSAFPTDPNPPESGAGVSESEAAEEDKDQKNADDAVIGDTRTREDGRTVIFCWSHSRRAHCWKLLPEEA